ncbi:serine hydrolase domain-containing protein [Bacillus sp. 31A1R]|uniref:Serine hydrolase domain-containing protein n=1 Tax=Robertmurraya mangrovi TaxID=3098077 RepID=A0ABU5IWM2_9BACI|nr:serine hydrolase domain-containing protein [Bacillus sp. 31A1R]MDZ5471511.1 serine hydrolase domain-containing protein [Bacillus sp. 31A1R]
MLEIENYLYRKSKFSGVVSIEQKGKIIFEKAYGWADQEGQIKNELSTKFSVGSLISKPITAVCILQLVSKDLLSLNQDIAEYFPAFTGKGITVLHLLNHTSGIVNYLMLRNKVKWDQDYSPEQILSIVEKEKLKFEAGAKSMYCNTGYLMLGLLIEMITSISYEDYVRRNIFRIAQMNDSGFIRDDIDGVAQNYINGQIGQHVSPTLLFACGEVVTTLEDVRRFERALKRGLLLNQEYSNLMEQMSYKGKYVTIGHGWFIKNLFGHKSICHPGNHPSGTTSHMERYMEDDLTIIVISNNVTSFSKLTIKEFSGTLLNREIASILYGEKLHFYQKII